MDREVNIDRIRALEEQIKEQEWAIAKLKRARNSLLNISKLPPEVLGNIFRWNVTIKDDFGGLEEMSHNFLLVCYHWFEVAARTPELWSFWGTDLEDWEEEHLSSNVRVPLDLVLYETVHTFGSFSESQRTVLKDRAARDTIRRIHLHIQSYDLSASIMSSLTSPCGGLQTNSLESLILYDESSTPPDVSFLARFRLPRLRHLNLSGCIISSWDHLISQTTLLTTLELFPDRMSSRPTILQLLSMLASNPHLRGLTVNEHAIPDDDGDRPHHQVPLHHLEKLRLDGNVEQVFGLLSRLEYPENMGKLSLSLSHCAATDVSQTIGPYLRDHIRRRSKTSNELGLFVSCLGSMVVFHAGEVAELYLSTPQSKRMSSFVHITIGFDQILPVEQEKATLDLIAHTPQEEIAYFRACRTLAAVEDLRVQMPNLKTLDLCTVPLYTTFPEPDFQAGSGVQENFPPSLQHLFLERLVVNGYDWIPLTAFLLRRASSGNRLDLLRVDGPCHMCFGLAEKIRGVVQRFDIDQGCLESWCPFGTCL